MNSEEKIVAIYTRVSTIDQAKEGHSLEEQEKRLRAMCEANNYKVYKVYTDEAISGKSADNRPAYQQMLKDMRNFKFNLIVAFKMDRLSRSIIDFEEFFNEIKKYNCGVEFLFEKIDTSGATGMFFARILGLFAQFERELIKERTLVGVESAVDKGHFGGKPPLGYRHKVDETGKHRLKEWEIDSSEAEIVKEIFELCASGNTYVQISNILKEKYPNVVSYIRTDKKTGEKKIYYRQWTDASISVILNNKCYMGTYEHRKRVKEKETKELEGVVPAIITMELFNDCQDMIARNGRNYYRSKKYLFMQLLKCPRCGRILACNGTKKKNNQEYLYYKCKDCGVYVREEIIEEALINKLNSLLELSNLISDNNLMLDSELAEDFENCRLDHRLRFAIDDRIIKDKLTLLDSTELNELWKMTSYEAKCKFIHTYIDNITIKQFTNNQKKIKSVEIVDLKLKSNKMSELLDYSSKGLLDKVLGSGVYKTTYTEMKHESDALEYINLLRKKYKVMVMDWVPEEEYFLNTQLFKIIKVNPKSVVEKKKTLGLFILEPSTFLMENCHNC